MSKIKDNLSIIKSYMKIIDDSQREIANLLLQIELEVYETEAHKKEFVKSIDARTPEVRDFFDRIDRMFGEED